MFSVLPQFPFGIPSIHDHIESAVNRDYLAPLAKRRKCNSGTKKSIKKRQIEILKKLISKTDDKYIISLSKRIPNSKVNNYINDLILEYKESHYRPTYNLVNDGFGNQYYVEEEPSSKLKRKLKQEAMDSLDMVKIGKELSQREFEDYTIHKGLRSNEIVLKSSKDTLNEEYTFDEDIKQIKVLDFSTDVNYDYNGTERYDTSVILEIDITNHHKETKKRKKHHKKRHHHKNQPPSQKENENQYMKHPPILEELEDIEIQLFNQSLSRNPQPSYIIEEI